MPITRLEPGALSLTIDPGSLEFPDTSALINQPLDWIGQERARQAAYFGLEMEHLDYNLFVLGETGSGRSSLLRQAMTEVAAGKPVPPDLCYVHNFDVPERPLALRLPAGKGDWLRQQLAASMSYLLQEIPERLNGDDFKAETEGIENRFKLEEGSHFEKLNTYAEALRFAIRRESGQLVFTLLNESGKPLTEEEILTLPRDQRAILEQDEQTLRNEITSYLQKIRILEQKRDEELTAFCRNWIEPLLNQALDILSDKSDQSFVDHARIKQYLNGIKHDILENLDIFQLNNISEEKNPEALKELFNRYRINIVVDNRNATSAPVVIDDNPSFKSMIGSISYQSVEGMLVTDFMRIRAGSLLKAHGGFLMLHLDDLLTDAYLWEKTCRFLRNHILQIEESWTANAVTPVIPIEPESVKIDVRIILIGSREQYYAIQEENPELARRFRVKVDFAASFLASAQAYRMLSVFISHLCQHACLPHFSQKAVVRVLQTCHRTAEDQKRLSANFSHTEMLVIESALQCKARGGIVVEESDVTTARQARTLRHNYPDQCAQEAIADGDVVISVYGEKIGQINGLSLIELGDHSFGIPARITAHTFAGEDGLLNIEREVGMSGPIHDKGVFILQNFLSALFHHNAPLALNASIVFEQEYYGVEGDSASCAELYALLSALSGLPFRQSIAVTGAINQFGEMLPVGGINEKIEGFFRVCETAGLDGTQGVLIPNRNCRHLILNDSVIDAVSKGMFHIYAIDYMYDGLELLSGFAAGISNDVGPHEIINYSQDTVLGHAQKTLRAYRMACHQQPQRTKISSKRPSEQSDR
ncbi:ATP-binding protein [Nitrosomonas sp. HPC101]|uniref:Lon protease family protein n=1 Tax=Nitrosomonas sp. HPC101 TaxID=1658667 RepID=UPI00137206DD|nr:ATP-binding protein [Nitrosomonas sp. HPC101]MXS86254.1 ATP-binding protein [Nitrosomonas sp. HPC101]